MNLFVAEVSEISKMETWMEDMGLKIRIMGQLQSENLGDRIFHALKHLKLSGYSKVTQLLKMQDSQISEGGSSGDRHTRYHTFCCLARTGASGFLRCENCRIYGSS